MGSQDGGTTGNLLSPEMCRGQRTLPLPSGVAPLNNGASLPPAHVLRAWAGAAHQHTGWALPTPRDREGLWDSATGYWYNHVTTKPLFLSHAMASLLRSATSSLPVRPTWQVCLSQFLFSPCSNQFFFFFFKRYNCSQTCFFKILSDFPSSLSSKSDGREA